METMIFFIYYSIDRTFCILYEIDIIGKQHVVDFFNSVIDRTFCICHDTEDLKGGML